MPPVQLSLYNTRAWNNTLEALKSEHRTIIGCKCSRLHFGSLPSQSQVKIWEGVYKQGDSQKITNREVRITGQVLIPHFAELVTCLPLLLRVPDSAQLLSFSPESVGDLRLQTLMLLPLPVSLETLDLRRMSCRLPPGRRLPKLPPIGERVKMQKKGP